MITPKQEVGKFKFDVAIIGCPVGGPTVRFTRRRWGRGGDVISVLITYAT